MTLLCQIGCPNTSIYHHGHRRDASSTVLGRSISTVLPTVRPKTSHSSLETRTTVLFNRPFSRVRSRPLRPHRPPLFMFGRTETFCFWVFLVFLRKLCQWGETSLAKNGTGSPCQRFEGSFCNRFHRHRFHKYVGEASRLQMEDANPVQISHSTRTCRIVELEDVFWLLAVDAVPSPRR